MNIFFVLFLFTRALIRECLPNTPIIEYKQLPDKTVVLIEVQIYIKTFNNTWQVMNKNDPFKYDLVVENAADRDWTKLSKGGVFNAEFIANYAKNTFFFTSANDSMHRFSFHFDPSNFNKNNYNQNGTYGAEIKIYEGRANNPQAISQMDSTIRELDRQIKFAISACKEIDNVLKFDSLDEMAYDNVIAQSARIIIFSIFLKIVATTIIMMYLNRRLKQFYITNKIVGGMK